VECGYSIMKSLPMKKKKKGDFVRFIESLRYFFLWCGMVWLYVQQFSAPFTEVLPTVCPGLLHRYAFFAEMQC